MPKHAEYVIARKVLLDCFELLSEQSGALVLVGAQAIYLQTPTFDSGLPAYTTDGDIAIDPELLSANPDLAGLLESAGFRRHTSPGTWFSPEGVAVDLMVPSGALLPSRRRTAPLEGQGSSTARRTPGLELALVDNRETAISALDDADSRQFSVKVAGSAALVVAKLVKLEERLTGPRPDRILAKDASDVLRILRYLDARAIGSRLRTLGDEGHVPELIQTSMQFLAEQTAARRSPMLQLAAEYHQQFETVDQTTISFTTLARRVLDAYES
jgi:hypothetical protein